jgi:hypothetical protein
MYIISISKLIEESSKKSGNFEKNLLLKEDENYGRVQSYTGFQEVLAGYGQEGKPLPE